MKRLVVVVALATLAAALMGASVAWGYPSATCNGQPCIQGAWYTSPVSVTWDLNGGTNGGGCAPQNYATDTNQTYLGGEPMANWPGWTYCNDTTSGVLKYYFIKVETSSPSATVAPDRATDSGGWYNHAVSGFVSATAFSGIASCSSTTYSGPNSTSATVSATCVDNAGKSVTVASAPFAYDATPPTLTAVADPGDQSVALSWQAGGDVAPIASIQVTRTGGTKAADVATVYTGTAAGFKDTHLRNGARYTYTIAALDQAGNVAVQTVRATPGARLLAPAFNSRLSAPPTLGWTPVPGATYYNVQLLHRGKVLSVWPTGASLQLRRTWRYEGHRYRLKPGKYRWLVWPGFGRRRADRYGYMIGSGTFVIVR